MEFRILGSLEVLDDDGRALALRGRRLRTVLAILLLRANETVTIDRLVDELWPEDPPATATKVIQNLVSQLRKSVGERLETIGQSYRLHVAPDELDLTRFQRIVQDAKRSRDDGDAAAAAAGLADALSLWRGPPLADLDSDRFARHARVWLEELRLSALEERVAAELDLGRDGELIGELEQLLAEAPLRERLRAQLMVALYRAGRQAEALDVYRDGRTLLVEQLGLEPSEELQRLEQAILRHDEGLEPPSPEPATAPRAYGRPGVTRRRGRRRGLATLGALLVLAAIAAAALELARTRESTPIAVPPDSIAVVDARSGRVVDAIAVGARPVAVSLGAGAAWVANADDGTVSRIDLHTRDAVKTIGVGAPVADVAVGGGYVWLVTGSEGGLVKIDPRTDTIVETRTLGKRDGLIRSGAYSVAFGGGALWVGAGRGRLLRVDPRTLRFRTVLTRAWPPADVGVAQADVWTTFGSGETLRLDAATGEPTGRVGEPPDAVSLAVRGAWVWVGQRGRWGDRPGGAVWQIAADTLTVRRTIATGSAGILEPIALATDGRSVWVAGGPSGVLGEIDARTGALVRSVSLGGDLLDVASDGDAAWIAVAAAAG